VVEVLGDMGYQMVDTEDATYEASDQRKAYVVKVKNIAGDEVVTVIAPEAEFGANSISINTFSDKAIDEKLTQAQAKAIFDALKDEGVSGSGTIECKENAQNKYRDLAKVRQQSVVNPQQSQSQQ